MSNWSVKLYMFANKTYYEALQKQNEKKEIVISDILAAW